MRFQTPMPGQVSYSHCFLSVDQDVSPQLLLGVVPASMHSATMAMDHPSEIVNRFPIKRFLSLLVSVMMSPRNNGTKQFPMAVSSSSDEPQFTSLWNREIPECFLLSC